MYPPAQTETPGVSRPGAHLSEFPTFAAAKASCDKDEACIGFQNLEGGSWRTFGGVKWEGVTSKVRAIGEALNSWIPLENEPGR